MHFPHIAGVDIKLVEPLFALLEERHVTRAARRCAMSQSAMSRALQRLRTALDDELLVHSGGSYERTLRGDQLLTDLQELLPRLDAALGGATFDPSTTVETFRVATTDYASSVLLPGVIERCAVAAPNARIETIAWSDRAYDEIDAGRVHLIIIGTDGPKLPNNEVLFVDDFACIVAKNHPIKASRMTLKQYVAYGHAVISIASGGQPWIEKTLEAHNYTRRIAYRSPYTLSAARAASRSTMICTTARRLAGYLGTSADIRIIAAPREFPKITYGMTWHRRLQDDAAQTWFRDQVRAVAKSL